MDNTHSGDVDGVPFLAAIAQPVSVVVPGQMRADGRPALLSAERLLDDALQQGVMGLTFEGPTL